MQSLNVIDWASSISIKVSCEQKYQGLTDAIHSTDGQIDGSQIGKSDPTIIIYREPQVP